MKVSTHGQQNEPGVEAATAGGAPRDREAAREHFTIYKILPRQLTSYSRVLVHLGRHQAWLAPLWCVLCLVVAAILVVSPLRQTSIAYSDFMRFYHAALLVRAGHSPYDVSAISPAALALALRTGILPLGYVYPPFLSVLMIPVTALPATLAFSLWVLLLGFCIFISIAAVAACIFGPGHMNWVFAFTAWPLALLLKSVRSDLTQGNIDAILLSLLCVSLWLFLRGRTKSSALCLAIVLAIKPFFAVILLYFLWKRAYRLCSWAVALTVTFVLLPFVLLGAASLREWLSVSAFESSTDFLWIGYNQSFAGVGTRLFVPNPYTIPIASLPWLPRAIMLVAAACVLLVLAMRIRSHQYASTASNALSTVEYMLALVGSLLISPLMEDVHLAMLCAPFAAVTLYTWLYVPKHRTLLLAIAGALFLLFASPQIYNASMLPIGHPQGVHILRTAVYLFGVICLFGVLLLLLPRRPARQYSAAQ